MPKFVQIETASVRVTDPKTNQQHDDLELFALGDDGKVYRISVGHAGGWQVVE